MPNVVRKLILRPAFRLVCRLWPRPELTARLGWWGLGNQLFQIAGTYAIATRRGVGVLFDRDWPYRPFFSIQPEWFARLRTTKRCTEAWHFATDIEFEWRRYLQDISLWEGREKEIRTFLQPSERALEAVNAKYGDLLELPSKTALHVRRGDFLSTESFHRPCPMEYYERAIELVIADAPSTQFVIFSDDIAWCRKELPMRFPLRDPLFISDNPDWLDMALMSRCDHHICANSTFSLWGAFLSENPSPIVPWVTGVLPETIRRRHPPDWREIEVAPAATWACA
jgi:hypothetical protein